MQTVHHSGYDRAGEADIIQEPMNSETTRSPKIESLAWGRMTVQGIGSGKDFKLWPGGGREWDWNETGTCHVPGIQPDDVNELIEHGCRIIVLSRGKLQMLQVCPETLALLESKGIDTHVVETEAATKLYNELVADGEAVGGLFHSTC